MNMISTAFPIETDASNKPETLAKKFASVWEKKNSKTARAGGVSLMALSLAACGAEDETPFAQSDIDAATAPISASLVVAEAATVTAQTAAATALVGKATAEAAAATAQVSAATAVVAKATAEAATTTAQTAAATALVGKAASDAAAATALVGKAASDAASATAQAALVVAEAAKTAAETAKTVAETAQATSVASLATAQASLATAQASLAAETAAKAVVQASLTAETAAKAVVQASLTAQTTAITNAGFADVAALVSAHAVLTAPVTGVLTTNPAGGPGADNLVGSASGDTFTGTFGTGATMTAGDTIIDSATTDTDVLTLTGAAFGNTADTSVLTVTNVETVNVIFDTLTAAGLNAAGISTASTINASNVRAGSGAALTVTNITDGSTLSVSNFNTVTNATADPGGDLTINADSATQSVTGTVSTDGVLIVNAAAATGTVRGDSATGDVTINGAAAVVLTANSTSGDITVTGAANANVDATSTSAGNVLVTTALADDVVAATTGAGTVTVTGEGDTAMTVTARTSTVTLSTNDAANNATVTATGTGAGVESDTLNVTAGDDFTVANQAADVVETVNVTGTAAIDATITTSAATTYTGDSNVTFVGDHLMFHSAALTSGALLEISGAMNLDTDVSKVTGNVELSGLTADNNGGDSIILMNNNANLKLTVDQSNGLEINADDDVTNAATVFLQGTVNVDVAFDQSGTIVIDHSAASTDGFDIVNVTATAALTTGLDITGLAGATGTTINILGTRAVTVAAGTDAKIIDGSAMSGALTASSTSTALQVTGGSGNDALTSDLTVTTSILNGGLGNDTIDLGAAFVGTANGGDGADTLDITAAVDVAAATITGFETIDVNNNNVLIDEALVNGIGVVIQSTGGGAEIIEVKNITATTDLSNLSFADAFVTMDVDFANNRDASLGAAQAISVTGSSAAEVMVGGTGADTLLGKAGQDSLTGGAGADFLDGGAGNDTALVGGAGADTINGGAGNDTGITGDAGADVIDGGAGNDTADGGADNDTITGGEGADTLTGGDGADTIILTETSAAVDTVTVNAVVGTSSDSVQKVVAGLANDTGEDTLTGFAFGSDIIKIVATTVVAFVHGTDTEIGTANATAAGVLNDDFAINVGLIDLDNSGGYNGADDVILTFTTPNALLTEARFEQALAYDLTLTTGGIAVTTGVQADIIRSGTGGDAITTGAGADIVDFSAAGRALDGDGLVVVNNATAGTLTATDTLALTSAVDTITDFTSGTDKVDLTAFGLGAVTATVLTAIAIRTSDITDDSYALVYGTLAGTTLTVTNLAGGTHTALFFDADTAGTIDTEVALFTGLVVAGDLLL